MGHQVEPYARKMELVARQWSGKHGCVVWGIGLVTLMWSGDEALAPCDYCLYDKAGDGRTKNDHARAYLAKDRIGWRHPRRQLPDWFKVRCREELRFNAWKPQR